MTREMAQQIVDREHGLDAPDKVLAGAYLGLLEQLQIAQRNLQETVAQEHETFEKLRGAKEQYAADAELHRIELHHANAKARGFEEQLETAQQRVAFWKNQARRARMTDGICGVTVDSSWHEPVACAFGPDHEGDHSWASIPAHNPASRQDR